MIADRMDRGIYTSMVLKCDSPDTSCAPKLSKGYVRDCGDDIQTTSQPAIVHTTPTLCHSYCSLERRHSVKFCESEPKLFTPLIPHKSYKTPRTLQPKVNTIVRYRQEHKLEKESNV